MSPVIGGKTRRFHCGIPVVSHVIGGKTAAAAAGVSVGIGGYTDCRCAGQAGLQTAKTVVKKQKSTGNPGS